MFVSLVDSPVSLPSYSDYIVHVLKTLSSRQEQPGWPDGVLGISADVNVQEGKYSENQQSFSFLQVLPGRVGWVPLACHLHLSISRCFSSVKQGLLFLPFLVGKAWYKVPRGECWILQSLMRTETTEGSC